MPTTYRPYSPNQQSLLPQNPADWIEPGDLSHYVNDLVDQMDLSSYTAVYDGDGRRNQPYHPAMLLKVIIYGYATGVFSSRKLEEKMHRDAAFRMLAADNFPSYRTLGRFRQQHLGKSRIYFFRCFDWRVRPEAQHSGIWRSTAPKSARTPASARR